MNIAYEESHMKFTVYLVAKQNVFDPTKFDYGLVESNPHDLPPNAAIIPVVDEDDECISRTFEIDIPEGFDAMPISCFILDEEIERVRLTAASKLNKLNKTRALMSSSD